jgi:hypothetical protein
MELPIDPAVVPPDSVVPAVPEPLAVLPPWRGMISILATVLLGVPVVLSMAPDWLMVSLAPAVPLALLLSMAVLPLVLPVLPMLPVLSVVPAVLELLPVPVPALLRALSRLDDPVLLILDELSVLLAVSVPVVLQAVIDKATTLASKPANNTLCFLRCMINSSVGWFRYA